MGTNINLELARIHRRTGKSVVVTALVFCLAAAGFALALSGAGTALSAQPDTVSVDRTHKGDRSALSPKPTSNLSSPVVTTLARPPVGCESAFSRTVDPERAQIFGRCIS
jgi:hypothetical protein